MSGLLISWRKMVSMPPGMSVRGRNEFNAVSGNQLRKFRLALRRCDQDHRRDRFEAAQNRFRRFATQKIPIENDRARSKT